MVCIGARFDDRTTGRTDQFSPGSKKIHIDIDPSSINKNIKVDVPIIGDVAYVLEEMIRVWKDEGATADKTALKSWWAQIDKWRAKKCLAYQKLEDVIMGGSHLDGTRQNVPPTCQSHPRCLAQYS